MASTTRSSGKSSGKSSQTSSWTSSRASPRLPSLEERQLIRRRCTLCDWAVERVEDAGADPDCPQCHGPTVVEDSLPLPLGIDLSGVPRAKNLYAAALGRLGGVKGGVARAKSLSPARRREIARKAARARWAKTKTKGQTKNKTR